MHLRPIRPQFPSNILHKFKLSKHLLLSHPFSTDGNAREAALGADADALQGLLDGYALALGDDVGGLLHAGLDHLGVLELGILGGDDSEDDVLALGEESEGLETAGAGVIVLEEEGIVVEGGEHLFGDFLVGALAEVHGLGEISCRTRVAIVSTAIVSKTHLLRQVSEKPFFFPRFVS